MSKRNVILELNYSRRRARAFSAVAEEGAETGVDLSAIPIVDGVEIDASFAPVKVPALVATEGGEESVEAYAALEIDERAERSTFLVRGTVEEDRVGELSAAAGGDVVGVYSDVSIETMLICPGAPPLGTHHDVARLLDVPYLRQQNLTGRGVAVAIVDTGINLAHLRAHGQNPAFDAVRSWVPRPGLTPGQLPVGHGTMCAFDACIAAPSCTLLDVAVLLSQQSGGSIMAGLLSDAVRAYAHLLAVTRNDVGVNKRYRALVVNNSWGMFHPSWDFPVGHPGNYSHNPNHPFNRIVGVLERAGADILFAAGNCGRECPDGRCQGLTTGGIYGANSHPQVTSVAGVDTQRNRVGYSTIGPGRLDRIKPDVCGYTHFAGSGVYPADGGTSAATPVVAGLVAAVRTRRPVTLLNPLTWPATVRRLLRRTAIDRGAAGFDFEYGYGIVNGRAFARAVVPGLGSEPAIEEGEEAETDAASGVKQSVTVPPGATAAPTGLIKFFGRISPDASPGLNQLTIRGLPHGTRSVSAWMTEWVQPNNPHAGDARYDTISVQLAQDGQVCRVFYYLRWGGHLPTAVQLIFG